MKTTLQTVPACAETFTLVPASWVAVVYGKGRASKVTREGFKVRYSCGVGSITLAAAGGNPGHLRDATFRSEAEARAEMTRRHPNAREVAND